MYFKKFEKLTIKNIAKNIKKQRKLAMLTQQQLAEKVGKTKGYIMQLERGRFDTRIIVILKIAKCLNLEINQLISFDKIKKYRRGG